MIIVRKIYQDENGNTIEFIPDPNVPGFSHRICYNNMFTRKWLSNEYKPSAKTAKYFFELFRKEEKKCFPQK